MPVFPRQNPKHRRTMLANWIACSCISFAFGVTTNPWAFGQQCDQCISKKHSDPACGCETSTLPQRCSCKRTTSLSFAEKILKRLDQIGDQIEGKTCRSTRACEVASCDVVSAKDPSCGCEPCDVRPACDATINAKVLNCGPHSKAAVGSIGDVPRTEHGIKATLPPIVRPSDSGHALAPKTDTNPSSVPTGTKDVVSQETTSQPAAESPEPRRTPFSQPPQRTIQNAPSAPTPSTPQSLPSDSSAQPLPDVLIDPFKDDPSAEVPLPGDDGVQLTSGRKNSLRSPFKTSTTATKPSRASEAAPIPMTKAQRAVHESGSSVPNRYKNSSIDRAVIPSAFFEAAPLVKSAPVKTSARSTEELTPSVGRIPVPGR